MTSKTTTAAGALHPILFFAGLYVVVLMFSIFICSVIFYSCNTSKAEITEKSQPKQAPATGSTPSSMAAIQ